MRGDSSLPYLKIEVKRSHLDVAWLQMPLKLNHGLNLPIFRVNDQVFTKLPNSNFFVTASIVNLLSA